MKQPHVTRCVCADMSFARWLALRRWHGWARERAAIETGCGEGCGSCRAYLDIVDETGDTEIPLLSACAESAAQIDKS